MRSFLILLVLLPFAVMPANGAEAPIDSLLKSRCYDCHQGPDAEGGLDLSRLSWDLNSVASLRSWVQIHDRVAKGEMPPDGDLPNAERTELVNTLSAELHEADLKQVQQLGRGPLRRLTRGEYEENLRALLRLPYLDVRDLLPADRAAYHSNKTSEVLDLTRVQLNAYLQAAGVALRAALAADVEPRVTTRYFARATKMFPKAVDHAGRESSFYAKKSKMIPLTSSDLARMRRRDDHDEDFEFALFRSAGWPYYGYPPDFVAKEPGVYRVRFAARAVRQIRDFRLVPATAPQPMTFRARKPSQADVTGDVRATGGVIDVAPSPGEYETTVLLKEGETFEYSLLGLPVPFPITSHGGPLYYDFPPMPVDGHPGVAFRWIEIVGPLDSPAWPPASHRVLFGDLPIRSAPAGARYPIEVISESPRADAARLLNRFTANAARQPLDASVVDFYLQLVLEQLDAGESFIAAMMTGYEAFLCSGHFLFLQEPRDGADQFALASRLSHLLWNSRPDAALLARAESGELSDPVGLRHETDRFIDDERFQQFIANFTRYWLDLKELKRDPPDIRLYPEYRDDDYLIESMEWETLGFVTTMFRENLPVTNLIDSDFVMVNDRLARHYGLPPVHGSRVRKVMLPEWSPRGGLLTQAAVLKVTANGTTTSPVTRGAWVMDRILGDPPPPPPPNVPAVEPDIRGATTIRAILEAHAASDTCAACHRRFDPLGMALESFDILGAWRDRYRSLEKGDEITGIDRAGHKFSYRVAGAVDTAGQLEEGTAFQDIEELKPLLADKSRQMAGNLLERFVVYATGTPVRFSDRAVLESILDECQEEGFRTKDLLHGVIQSRIFRGTQTRVEVSHHADEAD